MTNSQKNRVVVINPENQTVTELLLDKENSLQQWYTTIGNGCRLVQVAMNIYDENADIENSILMDEEINLRPEDIKGGFVFADMVITNTALFVGCDNEGDTVSTTVNVPKLAAHLTWLTQQQAIEHAERVMNTPIQIYTIK
jgi:hypothetical protein